MLTETTKTDSRNILSVALDVHSTAAGSFERSEEDQRRDLQTLRERLDNWKPTTHEKYKMFDDAVAIVMATAYFEATGGSPRP